MQTTDFTQPRLFNLETGQFMSVNKNTYRETGVSINSFSDAPIYEPKRDKKNNWVLYGSDNRFPFTLLELAKTGLVHNSLIITKTNMTAGEGLEFLPTENGDENSIILAKDLFKQIGIDFVKHKDLAMDLVLFGGSFVELAYGRNTSAVRELKQVVKRRFEKCRLSIPVEKEGFYEEISELVYIHDNWQKSSVTRVKPIPVPYFYKDFHTKGEDNYIYMIGSPSALMEYYPRPDYLSESAMLAIKTEKEILQFDYNELANGMAVSGIITIVREDYSSSEPEKEKALREKEDEFVKNRMKGSANEGNVLVNRLAPDAGGMLAEKGNIFYTPIERNNDADRHRIITERKDSAILSAHGVPMGDIAGLPSMTKTGLSSQSEMLRMAVQVLYYNRIKPMQMTLQNFYTMLLELHNIPCKAVIQNNLPLINYVSDDMWQYAFTKDEFRNSVGYSNLTEEQKTEFIGTIA